MQKLADADLGTLRWTRSGGTHSYQLSSGSNPIATLHWAKAYGTLATAESEGARWTLKRSGFLTPVVTVRDATSGKDLAVLHVHLNNSPLQFPGGATYRWSRTGFWLPSWHFQDATGAELVNFEPVRAVAHLEGGLIVVSPAGRSCPDLLALLVTGWYFIFQSWIEDEATAASVAVLSATSG
ncbi:MAG: hypothetical protein L3K14_00985 [Thermoplasmata archaeon]|nr:hypothetical protein [Thermoplasmata archaeon]